MKILQLISLILIVAIKTQAQDAIFTQYYASPLQINPAFTGNTAAPRIALNYRDQWHNVPRAYSTYSASYDQFIEALNSGIGVTILGDQAGDGIYQQTAANVTYAYRLQTKRNLTMKLGVDVGLGQSNIDWNRLVFLDMIDPINGSTSGTASQEVQPQVLNKSYLDFGAGFVAYTKNFYAGLALKHLNTPNVSILDKNPNINTGLPIRYTVHTGYEIVLRENRKKRAVTYITPNLLFLSQGPFKMLNIGVQGGMNGLFGGLGFRHAFRNPDAVLVNVGWQKGIFKIGYSHDITINGLPTTFGSHELSVLLNFDELVDHSKPKYNDCFRFFR
jgi:type IX secretion system PorP/SprF family membrane protein